VGGVCTIILYSKQNFQGYRQELNATRYLYHESERLS
jgi:hypothetical protein